MTHIYICKSSKSYIFYFSISSICRKLKRSFHRVNGNDIKRVKACIGLIFKIMNLLSPEICLKSMT